MWGRPIAFAAHDHSSPVLSGSIGVEVVSSQGIALATYGRAILNYARMARFAHSPAMLYGRTGHGGFNHLTHSCYVGRLVYRIGRPCRPRLFPKFFPERRNRHDRQV
jgi:hypothetical protein